VVADLLTDDGFDVAFRARSWKVRRIAREVIRFLS